MTDTASSLGYYNEGDDSSIEHNVDLVHQLVVHGATTGTSTPIITTTKKALKGRRHTAIGAQLTRTGTSNQQNSVNEQHILQEENDRLHRELRYVREEKQEVEAAFRRLDQEVGNGYNLKERADKEIKINELVAKNQKMAGMLEKELQNHEALRLANLDLVQQVQRQQEQLTIVNQVLSSVETKYTALVASHQQLTNQHANAQSRIVTMQEKLLELETHAASMSSKQPHIDQYEEKIRQWEIQYREAQSRLETKTQHWRAQQDQNRALQIENEHLLETRDRLEKEMADVHDQMIRMTGSMRAMEARVEATMPATQSAQMLELFKQRIRVLEEELLTKDRHTNDLVQTVDGVLTTHNLRAAKGQRKSSIKLQRRSTPASANPKMSLLMQKLHAMEASRDHKARCLGVLLDAFPVLLQRLDGVNDQFQAATESNTILSNAIQQLQESNEQLDFLSLARESFALNLPYQHDLLSGYNASRAFAENASHAPPPSRRFAPFHAIPIVQNDPNSPYTLIAEKDDPNGTVFLHRSKINGFLQVLQSKTMPKAKFQAILINKVADLLSQQRELIHQQSSESVFYKTTVSLLEREVEQLKSKLHTQSLNEAIGSRCNDDDMRYRTLLIKLVEHLCQQQVQLQETFLTQLQADTRGSEMLTRDLNHTESGVELDLSHCYLSDDDLEPVLLKIAVSGVRVKSIRLDGNALSDNGAATLAVFLETSLSPLQSISIEKNAQITKYGMQRIYDALLKNKRVQHVESIKNDGLITLNGLAAQQDFDMTGLPTVVLQVVMSDSTSHGTDENGEEMIERLKSAGLCKGASRPLSATLSRAVAVYTSTTPSLTATRRPRSAPSISTPTNITRSNFSGMNNPMEKKIFLQRQKELKFRALQGAIQRAESIHPLNNGEEKRSTKTRAMSLAQMQYLLKNPKSSNNARHTKLRFAQSHLATIRGLKR